MVGRAALALAVTSVPLAAGRMYDVLMKGYLPNCTACDLWSAHSPTLWAAGSPPAEAGSSCAMPAANITGHNAVDASFAGPWCYCAGVATTCIAPQSVPEQINLQLAGPDVVVVGFVTYDRYTPSSPPVAELQVVGSDDAPEQITGVSHMYYADWYSPPRNYTMNFVKFMNLKPRQAYNYKVAGSAGAQWSESFTFRAPYARGPTKVAMYGDMGNTINNNMANLMSNCADGTIDAVVHLGDHAYDLGNGHDMHGDAYMNAFQPTLANCPWLPVIGNHESYLGPGGDKSPFGTTYRYLNQTWGIAYGQQPDVRDTATTALGHLLTKGTYHAAGLHGSTPSGTSRYNSIDIGLFHIVALDLNPGKSPDGSTEWALWNNTEGGKGPSAQGLWLEADLAAAVANRRKVPWIIVTSHFPLLHTMLEANSRTSASHYIGDEGEDSLENRPFTEHHFADCPVDDPGCFTVGQLVSAQAGPLIPIMEKYAVDAYVAGHVHSYEVTWPQLRGNTTSRSFDHPTGIVYITEGNGGVPGTGPKNSIVNCSSSSVCRKKGNGGAFGRWSATDGHTLTYEHVENPTGAVTDTWKITK